MLYTREKTHSLLQVVNRREQCCAANCEQCCAAPSEQCCQQGCSAMITINVVTALFNHQYCYNLLTRLSNNDKNNDKLVPSILFSPVSTTVVASSMLNNIVETIVNNIAR